MTADLKIPVFAVNSRKRYLGEDSEIGLSSPALACYQFDGSGDELTDRTGNGYTLTVADGTRYYNALGGVKALEFNGALGLLGPDTEDLRITGAITIEFVGLIREKSSDRGHVVYIGGDVTAAESLITNVLTDLRITTSHLFEYAGEYAAAGTNVVCSAFSQKAQNEVHYFAMTRSSDGLTIKLYIDGVLVQTRTADHITEKDASGNLHRLTIGNWYTTGSDEFLDGVLTSVRISNAELTATQIANVYDQIW